MMILSVTIRADVIICNADAEDPAVSTRRQFKTDIEKVPLTNWIHCGLRCSPGAGTTDYVGGQCKVVELEAVEGNDFGPDRAITDGTNICPFPRNFVKQCQYPSFSGPVSRGRRICLSGESGSGGP
jgi:hypothetical protein